MEARPDSQVLLVEGSSDKYVVKFLLKCRGLSRPFKIEHKGGFKPLHESIPSHIKGSGIKAVGILVDANDNFEARWQSICEQLPSTIRAVQQPEPEPGGNVFLGPRGQRIGVWLMPDNQNKGELEDFVHGLIPSDDPILPHAKKYIDNIPEEDRKFKDRKRVKAYVHAWLAACKKPRPMGLAIKEGDLDKNAAEAVRFVDWLRRLFQF